MKKIIFCFIFIFLFGFCVFADSEENLTVEKSGEIYVENNNVADAMNQLTDRLVKEILNERSGSSFFGDSDATRYYYEVSDEKYDKENKKCSLKVKLVFSKLDKKFADYIKEQEFIIKNGVLVKYNGNRKKIKVPDNVTAIANAAFYQNDLEEIILPNGLKKIGDVAFFRCRNLKNIVIPDSVEYIGIGCFFGCYSLNKVHLSENLKKIPNNCFCECNLLEIVIPDSVTEIGSQAFFNNSNLSEIKIGVGVEVIEYNAFCNIGIENTKIKKIYIPKKVKKMGPQCFYGYSEIEELKFEEGIEFVDLDNFRIRNLSVLDLPNSLKYWSHNYSIINLKKIKLSKKIFTNNNQHISPGNSIPNKMYDDILKKTFNNKNLIIEYR